jgi:hypothetical protein
MHFRLGMIPLFLSLIVFLNSVFYTKWYVCMWEEEEEEEIKIFLRSSFFKALF